MGKLLITVFTTLLINHLLANGIANASTIALSSSPEYADAPKENPWNLPETMRSGGSGGGGGVGGIVSGPNGPTMRFALNGGVGAARSNYRLRNALAMANANGGLRSAMANDMAARPKVPIEMDLLVDDDDLYLYDKSKRYDDYGHMRFGKRSEGDQFDDYGHMRFGKKSKLN